MRSKVNIFVAICSLGLASCGGGGGGGGGGADVNGTLWLVQAGVTQNGCNERIAPVTQEFIVNTSGDTSTVDTSIATATGTFDGDSLVAGYSEANGGCTRNHMIEMTGLGEDTAQVFLVSGTSCDNGVVCVNNWTGTATRSANRAAVGDGFKVRGENCIPAIPQVGYRPSAFECNGAASVLMRDSLRNNYSVVVRRNGQFNDRDPNNPTCGTNQCSPYKTQKRMELPEYQVNCLGDSGFSALYDEVLRISVKFSASVVDATDPSQFEQYCIPNVEQGFN